MAIIFATSLKKNGSMGMISGIHGEREVVNRRKFFKSLGIDPSHIVLAQQAHGSRIAKISRIPSPEALSETDGLITNVPNIFLGILTADCFPIFFHDRKRRAVGIAHAGWRGITKEIISNMTASFQKNFKSNLRNLHVVIGPGIRACHFEIQSDVLPYFQRYKNCVAITRGKILVDLPKIIVLQLVQSGVLKSNIRDTKKCTYHMPQYASYRRDKHVGNMISVIGYRN